ncbi:MAG: PilN domain-containing protein [Thermodesulfobacteriota bacterium]|nr:PilN domain-containing protein [Thermodesulfobacteriota bacterium]
MIRINLLPYREKQKKASIRRLILIGMGSSGLFFLLLISLYLYTVMGIARLQTEVKSAHTQLNTLTKVTGDLKSFKANKLILEKKIGIINTLEKDRAYPAHLMDEIASRISPGSEWLTSISQRGTILNVTGVAINNPAIAQFMKVLEGSPYIRTVDLVSSSQRTVSGVKMMEFELLCMAEKG